MISFLEYLEESTKWANAKKTSDTVYVAMGRFNPITNGHKKLFDKLQSLAKDADCFIFTSRTQDKKKNPLSYSQKMKYLTEFENSKCKVIFQDDKTISVWTVIELLDAKGYKNINLLGGSDRVAEYKKLVERMKLDIDVQIISSGERDPDSDDISGVSATLLRQYAKDDDFDNFKKNVPFPEKLAKDMFLDVKSGLGV